ncbi:hypothetical protein NLG97_g7854 [Lecanicillium saksenae]|uniref:Uncharacterized protein n=1 Tax=Lecanicillium saksenae TaxID=468837 RepID=A0ACC1QNK6_9HYPO|nr:hypothetical protein NLG97_g7854 [Lecanicillium saksenae]
MNIQASSSGWETEVDYDTGNVFPNNTGRMSTKSRARFKNQKTITLVLSPTRNPSQDLRTSMSKRRNTMPSSGSSGVLSSSRPTELGLFRDDSFISRSSIYSDISRDRGDDSQVQNEKFSPVHSYWGQARPATGLLDRGSHENLTPSYSKSSTIGAQKSATSTCRSLFLSPSAERDVSRALRTLETRPTAQRRVSFTGGHIGDLRDIQEHHIRSFYNADAVASA